MSHTELATAGGIFEIEREEGTVVITPQADLREFAYREIEAGGRKLLDFLARAPARNVVLDFHMTDYFGSTALGFFVKLWKRVRRRNGRMAFCNVSDHEKEILQVAKLEHLWPVCSSRIEALEAVTE